MRSWVFAGDAALKFFSLAMEDLQWKKVEIPDSFLQSTEFGGLLDLEEIEGYDVLEDGRVSKVEVCARVALRSQSHHPLGCQKRWEPQDKEDQKANEAKGYQESQAKRDRGI